MTKQLVAIGECMIEMASAGDGLWRMGFAGDTFNTLWYARAGLVPEDGGVAYASAVGDDAFSDRMVEFMARGGIDTGSIRRIPGARPGLYLIEQKDGDRAFTYWRQTAAARQLAHDEAHLAAAIADTRCVYFSGITLAILSPERRDLLCRLAGEAREAGAMVVFDPNIRPALWEGEDALRRTIAAGAAAASVVLPSFDDETGAFGDATPSATVARYRAAGAGEVVVKNSSDPIVAAGPHDRPFEVEPVADVEVVDATAAGDSFNGAFIAARLSGADLRDAVVAGRDMSVRVIGARGAIVETPGMAPWARDPSRGPR